MYRVPIVSALLRFADGLRFRTLFLLMSGLFVVDLLLPDFLPFIDELLLGLMTLLLAAWKKQRRGERALEAEQEAPR